MSRTRLWAPSPLLTDGALVARLGSALRSAAPSLLFGLRLWAAVCLALYVSFWLELDNAFWAGTSAAIVCQPSLGASLRKGWYRMVGTVIGAVMIVALTACFPQQRVAFLVGLALWCAVCGLGATLLRNFAAYSAALAGYTAAIIASDELGAVGGANGDAFMLAVARASEICIGIVCAGLVLAGTDFGGARRRLAGLLATISAEITERFADTFLVVGPKQAETRPIRRDFLRRVIALDPVIDEAMGEASDLRYHSPILHAAVNGLFAALSGWQMAALHLELMPGDQGRLEAELVQRNLPQQSPASPLLRGEAARLCRSYASAVRRLIALPVRAPSPRLLADQAAEVLAGLSRVLEGLVLLVDGTTGSARRHDGVRLRVADWLPAYMNALRIFVTIGALELFWIATAWPSGVLAIVFAAIIVMLFSPRADQAYAMATAFMAGAILTVAIAAIVKFVILPGLTSFPGFSLALGLVLVPAGILLARQWQVGLVTGVTVSFVPLLAPANQMTYDIQEFFNAALAIVVGVGTGALAFRLLPPLSPALRARRLLALSLRDMRRLAAGDVRWTPEDWKTLIYSRLSALPAQAEPLQRAELLAALSLGSEIMRLRRVARRFDLEDELGPAFEAVAHGDSFLAREHLAALDHRLATPSGASAGASIRRRGRGRILAMSELLTRHSPYFDSRPVQ
jgi:uncharacterized membrane protein YccC